MKTWYEILEVSENASKEIIEKAYRVLAKKYHPDLQTQENRQKAENKMKEINEAYDILNCDEKRRAYDIYLEEERQKQTKKQEIENKNERILQEQLEKQLKQQMESQMQAQYEQKYNEAYESYLRRLGYKIKYKWTWKNYKEFLITILVIILICAILWFFPPTHKILTDLYESNFIIKAIIDIVIKILQGIWNGICSFFTNIF